MNTYYFYTGKNKNIIKLLRNNLGIASSLKTKEQVISIIEKIDTTNSYCRNQMYTEELTGKILLPTYDTDEQIVLYIENGKQEILGAIVILIQTMNLTDKCILVDAFCTPFSGGNGKKLLKYVIEFGRLAKMKMVYLLSVYTAILFYAKLGFKVMEQEKERLHSFEQRYNVFSPRSHKSLPSNVRIPIFGMIFTYATDYIPSPRKNKTVRSFRLSTRKSMSRKSL